MSRVVVVGCRTDACLCVTACDAVWISSRGCLLTGHRCDNTATSLGRLPHSHHCPCGSSPVPCTCEAYHSLSSLFSYARSPSHSSLSIMYSPSLFSHLTPPVICVPSCLQVSRHLMNMVYGRVTSSSSRSLTLTLSSPITQSHYRLRSYFLTFTNPNPKTNTTNWQ